MKDWIRDHLRRYLETNGEDGHELNGCQCLILTTLGRKSGNARQTPLVYGRYENNYIVVASKAGSETAPDWYQNLLVTPEVGLQVKAEKFRALSRVATKDEHEMLWPEMVKIFPDYETYQKKTERKIPVIILSPLVAK